MCPINGDDVIIQDHPVPLIIDFQQNVTNDNLLRSDLPRQAQILTSMLFQSIFGLSIGQCRKKKMKEWML